MNGPQTDHWEPLALNEVGERNNLGKDNANFYTKQ